MKLPPFFDYLMTNPMMLVGVFVMLGLAFVLFFFYRKVKPEKRVLYFSETERIGEELRVVRTSPIALYTNTPELRFFRNADAYNFKIGGKNVTTWLAKRASAFTFRPASTPEGKAIKVGSIWDGVKYILGEKRAENIEQDAKELFMESKLFMTCELERGYIPEGFENLITEDSIAREGNKAMAELIGLSVREGLRAEDWIRNIGLIACGVALLFILQQLGILG